MIICISGSVGSGKTSLAKALSRELCYTYIDVNSIIKKNKLSEGYDRKRHSHIIDTIKLNKYLIEIIKDNDDIIIDSHLSHHIPKKYIDLCIITRCNLKKLEKRLKQRGYNSKKIRDNLDAEIFDVCHEEAKEEGHNINVIDTSKQLNVKDIVKRLKLKKGKSLDKIVLKSGPIILRTIDEKDLKSLIKNSKHKSISEFTSVPYPMTEKTARRFMDLAHQNQVMHTGYDFGIELKGDIIGMMGLFNINKKDKTAEIGYWIGKEYRRKGYSKKAAEIIIDFAFRKIKLKKLKAIIDIRNKASISFIESLGFRKTTVKNKKAYFRLET